MREDILRKVGLSSYYTQTTILEVNILGGLEQNNRSNIAVGSTSSKSRL
jgi:hypothetical protein